MPRKKRPAPAASASPSLEPSPTRKRGCLMFPEQIRSEIFRNQVSGWWVRRTVAPNAKIRMGHSTVAWYEADVHEWLEQRRGA